MIKYDATHFLWTVEQEERKNIRAEGWTDALGPPTQALSYSGTQNKVIIVSLHIMTVSLGAGKCSKPNFPNCTKTQKFKMPEAD